MFDNSAQALLTLERRDELSFVGKSIQFDVPIIFGGQLLAQVLYAAANTLPSERCASHLSAHFLSYGDPKADLEFQVRALKDGKTTNLRQVEVMQEGRLLMLATVSFAQPCDGYEFHSTMPKTPQPSSLADKKDIRFSLTADQNAFPFVMVSCPNLIEDDLNTSGIWVKSLMEIGDSKLWQQMLFAFISDATILQSVLRPHGLVFGDPTLIVATMNHAIWFHRALNIQDWILVRANTPSTGAGRALALANAYSGSGELQCTVAQESVFKPSAA